MIYNMEKDEFIKYIQEHPDVPEKIEKLESLRLSVYDPLISQFVDFESLDMLDEKIEVLEALKDGKAPADIKHYEDILTLMPKNDDKPDDDGIVTITHWD